MFEWGEILRPGAPAAGSGPRRTGRVMAIVNVTPDSFSDGGRFLDPDAAVAHALRLAAEGADVLDVGGESTRPGAEPVGEAEERRRVVPVIERIVAATRVPVSVDTTKASVAEAALAAGASVVNDVSAGRFDPEILGVVASAGAGYVVMHMLGEPRTMQHDPRYADVVREVGDFLAARIEVAAAAGIGHAAIMADPGIGFGKTLEHNLRLLADLPQLARRIPVPLLIGTSRKSFLGRLTGTRDPAEREEATLATEVWALRHGAAMVRAHDARAAVAAATAAGALVAGEEVHAA